MRSFLYFWSNFNNLFLFHLLFNLNWFCFNNRFWFFNFRSFNFLFLRSRLFFLLLIRSCFGVQRIQVDFSNHLNFYITITNRFCFLYWFTFNLNNRLNFWFFNLLFNLLFFLNRSFLFWTFNRYCFSRFTSCIFKRNRFTLLSFYWILLSLLLQVLIS